MLPQSVNRKGKMMQICLDFAGVYCDEIFQDIMKNSAQELIWWEQGEELPWIAGMEAAHLPCPGEQALGHSLPLPWCQKLPWDFPGWEGISSQSWWYSWGCLVCKCALALWLGRQQSGVHCSPWSCSCCAWPWLSKLSWPGFQSQITP